MSTVRVVELDHVVVNTSDPERAVAWYHEELGLAPDRLEEWRRGEVLFPSVRVNEHTILDFFPAERTGENVNHVCLVIEPVDLDELKASGRFDVVSGPDTVYGARGIGTSLYVRDPDGNVVELRHYASSRSGRRPAHS
jgi:catechol 2,3-dioxygenase-like lactoylglutathione lyase family enzyme